MEAYVKSENINGLMVIEFFHPAHNSLPGDILDLLTQAIYNAGGDSNVKLILLKSGGVKTFCAGASFTELSSIQDEASSIKFFMGFANVINAIRCCGKIVVGSIQGKAIGGGVGLACACDYTLATSHASARLSELAVGFGPFVIGPVVERKIGLSAFSKMALTPDEWQTADWCKLFGMYHHVSDDIVALDYNTNVLTDKLLSYHTDALLSLKKIFWHDTDHWKALLPERAAISGRLLLSGFAKNAIQSFLSK